MVKPSRKKKYRAEAERLAKLYNKQINLDDWWEVWKWLDRSYDGPVIPPASRKAIDEYLAKKRASRKNGLEIP